MIDLTLPGDALTASLIDVPSVSGSEGRLADEVELALRSVAHLDVRRDGDTIAASTNLGHARRGGIAGRVGTVRSADSAPPRRRSARPGSRGPCELKRGRAPRRRAAASRPQPGP